MCRLRDEMLPLRAELLSSLLLLRESILNLQGELARNQWPEPALAAVFQKHDTGASRTIGLLAPNSGQRKVS